MTSWCNSRNVHSGTQDSEHNTNLVFSGSANAAFNKDKMALVTDKSPQAVDTFSRITAFFNILLSTSLGSLGWQYTVECVLPMLPLKNSSQAAG